MKVNRAAIVSLNEPYTNQVAIEVREKLLKREVRVVNKNPDVVIIIGREGSLLFAEQKFPEVPKLFLKHEKECKKCRARKPHRLAFIGRLKKGKFRVVKLSKLEVKINGKKKFDALNDINIHYKPPSAMRFGVSINGRNVAPKVIGDGLVVSTPHGSTAYFLSIVGKKFSSGIGIAFNNPTKKQKNKTLSKNSKIKVKIHRGPGVLCSDCNKNLINLKNGDVIDIQQSKEAAKLIKFGKEFRINLR